MLFKSSKKSLQLRYFDSRIFFIIVLKSIGPLVIDGPWKLCDPTDFSKTQPFLSLIRAYIIIRASFYHRPFPIFFSDDNILKSIFKILKVGSSCIVFFEFCGFYLRWGFLVSSFKYSGSKDDKEDEEAIDDKESLSKDCYLS